MLILLPPSETKRPGGVGMSLADSRALAAGSRSDAPTGLSFAQQDPVRITLLDALRDLAEHPDAMAKALKLGPKQMHEVEVNAQVTTSPTMPAIERFTGILFDAIDVDALDRPARSFLDDHVLIQSALFGLVRATDLVPAYRLSFDSRLPAIPPLKNLWAPIGSTVLDEHPGLILDLRSEGYAALAPLPLRDDVFFVRAMGRSTDGTLRQLNHFNKKGKGVFVHALATTFRAMDKSTRSTTVDDVLAWAGATGIELSRTTDPHS